MSAAIHYIPNDDLRRTIERKIELKRQLIRWTENEIKELEESLKKEDRVAPEKDEHSVPAAIKHEWRSNWESVGAKNNVKDKNS